MRKWIDRLIVVALLLIIVLSFFVPEEPGTRVSVGGCFVAENGYEYCNTKMVKGFAIVSVSLNEVLVNDNLQIHLLERVEDNGVILKSFGTYVLVGPLK